MCPSPKKRAANKNGRRWAFMHRHDIIHEGRAMFTRWRVVQTPWFGIYVHKHFGPDPDRALHNHPWRFTSLILRGEYVEEFAWDEFRAEARASFARRWSTGSIHTMQLDHFHSIRKVERVPTWTLLFVSKRRQKWGYATPDGWVEAQNEQQLV